MTGVVASDELVVQPVGGSHVPGNASLVACQRGTLGEHFDLLSLAQEYRRGGVEEVYAEIMETRAETGARGTFFWKPLSSYFPPEAPRGLVSRDYSAWDYQCWDIARSKGKAVSSVRPVSPWETGLILGYPPSTTIQHIYGGVPRSVYWGRGRPEVGNE